MEAFATPDTPLVVPNQVHGDTVLVLSDEAELEMFRKHANEGADGLILKDVQAAAMLCYADCVPVIIVSPSGQFAVVHAGWRGVMNTISVKAALRMAQPRPTGVRQRSATKIQRLYWSSYSSRML